MYIYSLYYLTLLFIINIEMPMTQCEVEMDMIGMAVNWEWRLPEEVAVEVVSEVDEAVVLAEEDSVVVAAVEDLEDHLGGQTIDAKSQVYLYLYQRHIGLLS